MLILKFLHILSMFVAVTLLVGGSLYLTALGRRGDRIGFVRLGRVLGPIEGTGVVFAILGAIFGLATAVVGGLDLTQPWLVIAYVLFVILFIIGFVSSARLQTIVQGVKSELEAEGPGAATADRPIDLGRLELLDLASTSSTS